MSRIEAASGRISDIIRLIDDIASRRTCSRSTPRWRGRAGDAGKGFAVVASEVRTLAQRSGEAARDIAALINSSNTEVSEGVGLVRDASQSLKNIVGASQQVTGTIDEISRSASEQANGIDEISRSVAHIDTMTQQTRRSPRKARPPGHALQPHPEAGGAGLGLPDRRRRRAPGAHAGSAGGLTPFNQRCRRVEAAALTPSCTSRYTNLR